MILYAQWALEQEANRNRALARWRPVFPHYKPGDECPRCGELCDDGSEWIDYTQVTYLMTCPRCPTQGGNCGTDILWYDTSDPDVSKWRRIYPEGGCRPQQLAFDFDNTSHPLF